jgi:exonuclease III
MPFFYEQSQKRRLGRRILQVSHWNVNGLQSKSIGPKLEDPTFVKLISENEIVLLTETHATLPNSISIPGYFTYQINRPKHKNARKGSGGIAILVRNNLRNMVSFIKSKICSMAWVKLKKVFVGHHEDLYIGAVYNCPNNSSYRINNDCEVWDILEKEEAEFARLGHTLVLGDFNTRIGKRPDFIVNDDNAFIKMYNQYINDEKLQIVKLHRNNCDSYVGPTAAEFFWNCVLLLNSSPQW